MSRDSKARACILAVGMLAGQAPAAAAYDHPLESSAIREAYFLGRSTDSEKLGKFLAQYVKRLPMPKTGPHVAEIELRTPYEQVVVRSREHSVGYSAQQAEQDYNASPDKIVVRIQINLTPTYAAYITQPRGGFQERPEDFWRDFKVRVLQDGAITPNEVSGRPLYKGPGPRPLGGALLGAEVVLEFRAADIASHSLRVEVDTPDGHTLEAEFDLRDLR